MKLKVTTTRDKTEEIIAIILAAPSFFMKKESIPPARGNQINKAGKLSNAENILNAFD
jgi:hypothetical protein